MCIYSIKRRKIHMKNKQKHESTNEKGIELKKSKLGLELLSRYRGAVMGFAALWILFFHGWQKLIVEGSPLFGGKLDQFEAYIKRIGFCGVDIFLFLSGIGLIFAIGKSNIFLFYYRRLKRVFLPFLIVGIIRCVTEKWEMSVFWKNVLCINFYKSNMYSFLWFVPAILTLYLLFPLYYWIFSKASDKLVFTGAVMMIWLFLSVFMHATPRQDLYGFTNRIPVFLFGVYAGWLTQNKKIEFTLTTWFFLLATALLGFYYAYLANFIGWGFIVPVSNCFMPNLLIAVSLPFLLAKLFDLICNIPKIGVIGKAIVKIFGFFGLFSLELYCVQEWLCRRYILAKFSDRSPIMKNLLILLICSAAGFVLYLAVKYFWKLVDWLISKAAIAVKKKTS